MRRKMCLVTALGLSVVLFAAGCDPPNHVDVPLDGRTMYFTMDVLPRYTIGQGSQIYAFDIETCRLRMLNDHPGMNTWVSGSGDGSLVTWTRCWSQSHFTLHMQRSGEAEVKQLGEAYNAYGASSVVPGDSPHILSFEGRALVDLRWALFDATGKEVKLPLDKELKALPTDQPAIAKDRVGIACYGLIKDYWKTNKKPWGVYVYVVDLSGAEPKATLAALFDVDYYQIPTQFLDQPTFELAFSPDGAKLAASWAGILKNTFYEIDATGKEKPKELFTDAKGYGPEWMSDGKGIVFTRPHPDPVKYNVMQVMLWRPGDKEPKPVVQLPGLVRKCDTAFRRMPDGRMRIAHFSDEGIHVVDCDADGGNGNDRFLSRDLLGTQKTLARFEYVFRQNPAINQWQAPYEVVKYVKVPTPAGEKREDDVARCLARAFDESKAWKLNAVAGTPVPSTPVAMAPQPVAPPSVPTPSIPVPTVPTIPAPSIPVPTVPAIPAIPAPAPEPADTAKSPDATEVKPTPSSQRGRMVKCPHCGEAFFLADDK